MFYPPNWGVFAKAGTLASDSPAKDKNFFVAEIESPNIQDPLLAVEVSYQTLAQALVWQKQITLSNNADAAVTNISKVLSEKNYSFDGFPATRLDTQLTNRSSNTQIRFVDFYIYAHGMVYDFEPGTGKNNSDPLTNRTAITVLDSLKIL